VQIGKLLQQEPTLARSKTTEGSGQK